MSLYTIGYIIDMQTEALNDRADDDEDDGEETERDADQADFDNF